MVGGRVEVADDEGGGRAVVRRPTDDALVGGPVGGGADRWPCVHGDDREVALLDLVAAEARAELGHAVQRATRQHHGPGSTVGRLPRALGQQVGQPGLVEPFERCLVDLLEHEHVHLALGRGEHHVGRRRLAQHQVERHHAVRLAAVGGDRPADERTRHPDSVQHRTRQGGHREGRGDPQPAPGRGGPRHDQEHEREEVERQGVGRERHEACPPTARGLRQPRDADRSGRHEQHRDEQTVQHPPEPHGPTLVGRSATARERRDVSRGRRPGTSGGRCLIPPRMPKTGWLRAQNPSD